MDPEAAGAEDAGVSVELPPALVRLFPGSPARVQLRAASVAEILAALDARWPGMRDRLCDSSPRIRRNIDVFVDGRRATLETPVATGARVRIVTAMIG
ncbi:MoaD/ThiS family protein [Propylenella binzhouense]|uniref:MoaD/ThiS family protein n=1 Tax=Propylenella binzhouense TaxID=2555902 RepID=A0A964WU53_9HYPH|nr:MoaD/ThiS family protein [Propylenella binzhouense]MYZ48742.1 MoaD/ThiS family protein [Propylenella binzhouense]